MIGRMRVSQNFDECRYSSLIGSRSTLKFVSQNDSSFLRGARGDLYVGRRTSLIAKAAIVYGKKVRLSGVETNLEKEDPNAQIGRVKLHVA